MRRLVQPLLIVLILATAGITRAGEMVNLDSNATVTVADISDGGIMRTVALIDRPNVTLGVGQPTQVECLYNGAFDLSPNGRLAVAPSWGCSSNGLPALPVVDLLAGTAAPRGPCSGSAGLCLSGVGMVFVGGLWGGRIDVRLRDESYTETKTLTFPVQRYATITIPFYVDTRATDQYAVDVTLWGSTGILMDSRTTTVTVAEPSSEPYRLMEAVTVQTPRGFATYALATATDAQALCLSPLPVSPDPQARVVSSRANTLMFARVLASQPTEFAFGPGRDCQDFRVTAAVRDLGAT